MTPKLCPFTKYECVGSRCALWDSLPKPRVDPDDPRLAVWMENKPGRCGMGKGDNFRDPHLDSE